MKCQLAKEKHAGLDKLPDGRWVYTPITVMGRKKNAKKYLVSEEVKGRILSSYRMARYYGIAYTIALLSSSRKDLWGMFAILLIIGLIFVLYFNYRFEKFVKNCPEFKFGVN